MAPVSWATTPPDLIEQIIAVLLGNKYEHTLRIRPSRGDRGLDVLTPASKAGYFDDYQVKKFATNLEDSQKRQIVKSLKKAIETHNDPSSSFLIENWLLTLPLDPTTEQYEWLRDKAAELNAPFEVKWEGLRFFEGLAADYPQVIDYYLRDGKERLQDSIAVLRDLARLPISESGATLEPRDVTERLGNLRGALNRDDPHYRYDFEVTSTHPILFERPFLIASVIDEVPGGYVTFHVYARYSNATEDRPIPVTFNIAQANLTPELLANIDDMLRYGMPIDLPESAVTEINIDMPGGLGLKGGTGSISFGPARAVGDRPFRVVWAIVPPDTMEPLAQLTFEMEAPMRGMSGGMYLHGVDATDVVAATILVDPPTAEGQAVRLSFNVIDPEGKPIGRVLPGLRFLRMCSTPNRLAFGPEYGSLTAGGLPLPDDPQAIPAIALEYSESLQAISQHSGKVVSFPRLTEVTVDDYAHVISVGKALNGENASLTWSSITARIRPGAVEADSVAARPMRTSQDFTANIYGVEHALGQFQTYLLSARVEGDLHAEPGPDGKIPVTIVPGDNARAIMTNRVLSPDEVQELAAQTAEDPGMTGPNAA